MVEENIRLYASHHQFYVQDSEPRGNSGAPGFWNKEAFHRKLAIGDGLLAVGTGTYDYVNVNVQLHETEPAFNCAEWDHITECSLEVGSKFVMVMGCLSSSGVFFKVRPGWYRVRACHANLAESEFEAPSDWSGEYRDWYLVQFWPQEFQPVRVVKQYERTTSN